MYQCQLFRRPATCKYLLSLITVNTRKPGVGGERFLIIASILHTSVCMCRVHWLSNVCVCVCVCVDVCMFLYFFVCLHVYTCVCALVQISVFACAILVRRVYVNCHKTSYLQNIQMRHFFSVQHTFPLFRVQGSFGPVHESLISRSVNQDSQKLLKLLLFISRIKNSIDS